MESVQVMCFPKKDDMASKDSQSPCEGLITQTPISLAVCVCLQLHVSPVTHTQPLSGCTCGSSPLPFPQISCPPASAHAAAALGPAENLCFRGRAQEEPEKHRRGAGM